MRAFVTGATGFIGGHVARKLRERGDDVVSLVRTPSKAGTLRELGCELVEGDLGDTEKIGRAMHGADACFHVAAMYKVGVPRSQHPAMFEANVRGTERVLDAAASAGVRRTVYVSTINVFGNTRHKVVAEGYQRPIEEGFLSVYDETKYLAHQAAIEHIRRGGRIIVVQPGVVYGPDDPSEVGNQLRLLRAGKLRLIAFPGSGYNFLHVDDAADGILLAHDRGEIGETYVLGGQIGTLRGFIETAADALGRRPPRIWLPGWAVKLGVPFGPMITRLMGSPPNLRELIRLADGVTYWASDQKARDRLGYAPRDLKTGLRQVVADMR